jgi:hypothetical protein
MKTLARERDRIEILHRLRALRPESARRWGRMSAHQMVCHLSDACRMATGEKPVSSATSVVQQTIVKWIALYVPVRWPGGRLLTRPELDQEIGGTRPAAFAADVAQLETLLKQVATQTVAADRETHPVFGRMSKAAWLRWAYLHADHHLRQFGV